MSLEKEKMDTKDVVLDLALHGGTVTETPDPLVEKSEFSLRSLYPTGHDTYTVCPELVRKFDMIILPLLAIIYFTHSLDRANLGNAKTDGIEKDIHLHGNQYSLVLTLFYIPYGTLNIPLTILAKRFSPARVIPTLMFGWGAISLGAAAVQNFGGLVATRVLLGAVEAGFVSLARTPTSQSVVADHDFSSLRPSTTCPCSTPDTRVCRLPEAQDCRPKIDKNAY